MRTVQSVSVTIPIQLAQALEAARRQESKSYSGIVTEAVRQYLEWRELKQIQKELSAVARARRVLTEEDVDRIVHAGR